MNSTVQCGAVYYNTSTIQYSKYNTVQCRTIQYGAVMYSSGLE